MSDGLTKRKSPKDSGDGKEVKISTAKREMPKESIDRRKMSDGIKQRKSPKGKRAVMAARWKEENKKEPGRPAKNAAQRRAVFPDVSPTRAESTQIFNVPRRKVDEASRSKKPGLGRNPFTEEPLSFIRDTSKESGPGRKRGRPKGSGSKGPEQWKRATFIIRREYLEALKKLAYWERVTATELLDQALETFLKGKRIKKHTKEIKENASKNG